MSPVADDARLDVGKLMFSSVRNPIDPECFYQHSIRILHWKVYVSAEIAKHSQDRVHVRSEDIAHNTKGILEDLSALNLKMPMGYACTST